MREKSWITTRRPGAREPAARELLRRLAEQLDGLLEGDERELAGLFLAALGPGGAQEQAQAVHMALIHQLAMQRVAVARRADLALRPQQVELGLTIRMLNLYHRVNGGFDRHHAAPSRVTRPRAARPAAARPEPPAAGYLVVPEPLSPEEGTPPSPRRTTPG